MSSPANKCSISISRYEERSLWIRSEFIALRVYDFDARCTIPFPTFNVRGLSADLRQPAMLLDRDDTTNSSSEYLGCAVRLGEDASDEMLSCEYAIVMAFPRWIRERRS